ncbi:Pyridine nucleotide-disulfide oxidoreductase domain-containing protein 1, partial [Blattella germanica]
DLQLLRPFSLAVPLNCEAETQVEADSEKKLDPSIDRSSVVPVETSIKYLKSGGSLQYNIRQRPGVDTVQKESQRAVPAPKNQEDLYCKYLRAGKISTGNPCPICRDEYLVLHHENVGLLRQFISPQTGKVLSPIKTGLCQMKHKQLLVAIENAKDFGYITFDVPFRDTFVIVGGGIAGVSCAEGLAFLCPEKKVVLITASPLIKAVTNIVHLTKTLCQFDVQELNAEKFADAHPTISVLQDTVTCVDAKLHTVTTAKGKCIKYDKLCICAGGSPNLIESSPFVLGIRDTESVKEFQARIQSARRIVVVGNGGIATELVHEVTGVEIVWAIKDKHISATFVDPGAAEFFQSRLLKQEEKSKKETTVKRLKFTVDKDCDQKGGPQGAALGPDWHASFGIQGSSSQTTKVTVEYETEVKEITSEQSEGDWPSYVHLTNGKVYGCDFVVSATGVVPNILKLVESEYALDIASDGGIKVDWKMETSVPDIFAAGDICTTTWDRAPHWFQMRLWTQARQMGTYAAKTMAAALSGEKVLQDFCFELFSHVTKFFGYKVVLLGLYNGQTLDGQYEILLRVTKGMEYVKLVMKDGRMQGAVLIGETDLEEMCENLILNQLDLSAYGEDLLNPDIDIEDYFD